MSIVSFFEQNNGRLQLCKNEAKDIIQALEDRGFVGVRKGSRIAVYWPVLGEDLMMVGEFRWVKKQRCWMFLTLKPYLRTRRDLKFALDQTVLEVLKIEGIQESWGGFRKSRTTKTWERYLGNIVSFYMRMFNRPQ